MSIYGNPVVLGPRWLTAKKVSILPFQNLHGYDHPWPAGGGKNLWPLTLDALKSINTSGTWTSNVYVYQGITYTVLSNADGYVISISVSGTNTNNTYTTFFMGTIETESDVNYTLNGIPSGQNLIFMMNITVGANDSGGGATFAGTGANHVIQLRIAYEAAITTALTVHPMIRLATDTDPTYAPYSNICPISGWEDCRVWVSPTPDPADGTTYPTIFGNPPRTVYGGEFGLETGVLTVDKGKTLLSVSSESYITIGTTTAGVNYASILFSRVGITLSGNDPVLSSDYTWYNTSVTAAEGMIKTYSTNFRIYDNRFTSAAAAKSILDTVQVVYPLETPQTYQLTPQQISFLHNQYFGANCGPVLLKVGKS